MDLEPQHQPFDYSQIDENVFIGSNACCRMHFDAMLLKHDITGDISLEEQHIDMPFGVTNYVWLPTPDHQPPTAANVHVGVEALDQMLKNGQRVYLHCKNGHGRAPTLYASYLILKKGMKPEDAIAHVLSRRPTAHLEPLQKAFLASL